MPSDYRAASALPSVRARVLAFVAISVGGVSGAVIGSAIATLLGGNSGTGVVVLTTFIGGLIGTAGVAIVAVLGLRAATEWRQVRSFEQQDEPKRGNERQSHPS